MKKTLVLLSIITAASSLAFAETTSDKNVKEEYPWLKDLSGNLTFVTNYVFRGISQTKNLPAIQGGLTYALPFNFYFNLWGSNVKFLASDKTQATAEFDTMLGYHDSYTDNFTYDLNFGRYNYPGARYANYNEFNSVFNLYFIQAGFSYSGNVYNTHSSGTYYNLGINYDIPSSWINVNDVSLLATIGHYTLPRIAGNSYDDYNIVLTKGFKNYKIAGQWTTTDGRQHNSPYDSTQLIAQVSADF